MVKIKIVGDDFATEIMSRELILSFYPLTDFRIWEYIDFENDLFT